MFFIVAEKILSDLIETLPDSPDLHHIEPTTFSIIMAGYNLHHQPSKTLATFDRIKKPNAVSYLLAVQACSKLKDLQRGKYLVNKLLQSNIDLHKNYKLQTALFDVRQ